MDNIINELIAIESRAHDLMSHALDEKRDLAIRIHAKTDEIKERIESETSVIVKDMYIKASAESAEKIDKLTSDAVKWQEDTKRNFIENSAKWEQEIFDRVVGLPR